MVDSENKQFVWFHLITLLITCVRAIGKLWNICFGVNNLNHVPFLNGVNNVLSKLPVSSKSLETFSDEASFNF